MSDPRYPIGKFSYSGPLTAEQKQQYLADIEQTPARLRAALRGLSDQQLDTPYRDGGWTPRQVAHHVPDSHMNSYMRFKLALTEDEPTIKPYMENLWAELPEAKHAPIEVSLALYSVSIPGNMRNARKKSNNHSGEMVPRAKRPARPAERRGDAVDKRPRDRRMIGCESRSTARRSR